MSALDDVFVIVQIAVICRDAEEPAHILGTDHFLSGNKSLVELLAVPSPNVLGPDLGAGQLKDRLGQGVDRGRRGLLNEEIPLLAMFKGKNNEIDRVVEGHHEAGHVAVRDGDRAVGGNLFKEERDDRSARGHDVAVAGQAQDGIPGEHLTRAGDDVLLHQGFGDAHGVDRVGGLVGREEDGLLHVVGDAGGDDVVRAEDVGLGGLERVELAGRDLLERRGGEDVVHPFERVGDGAVVTNIADVELQLVAVVLLAHVVLLLLVAGEDADLLDLGLQEAVHDRVPERAGSPGDQQNLAVKNVHEKFLVSFL